MTDGARPAAPRRPPLSLPARLSLLAWDTARPPHGGVLPRLVRAGALAELAQRGLLVDDHGIATPADLDSSTGDPVLDGLLELVRESGPRPWRAWVGAWAGYTFTAVRDQLTAGGWLRPGPRRALGFLPPARYTPARAGVPAALRERARRLLDGTRPAATADARDALVVVLAVAAGLLPAPPGADRAARERRADDLAGRAAAADPALGRVLDELRAALSATVPAAAPARG
ncbi:GOLPH3/VPS74 family protein [Streptomyces sp. NPDC003703]|uniref:GOLPH3/VPS74 family protein n=1 Tax=Streptomyces sp. NPDC003283 TaxID=3364681 RepID=UPI00369254CA